MILKLMLTRARLLRLGSTECCSQAGNINSVPSFTRTNLIGRLGGQFADGWREDTNLVARIVEIDGVGAFLRLHVIDAAQVIVRVAMDTMAGARAVHGSPASGDLEARWGDLEVVEKDFADFDDAANQPSKSLDLVETMVTELPTLSGLQISERRLNCSIFERASSLIVFSVGRFAIRRRRPASLPPPQGSFIGHRHWREIINMLEIVPDVFTWSWFSEPHGYDFNGHLARHAGWKYLHRSSNA